MKLRGSGLRGSADKQDDSVRLRILPQTTLQRRGSFGGQSAPLSNKDFLLPSVTKFFYYTARIQQLVGGISWHLVHQPPCFHYDVYLKPERLSIYREMDINYEPWTHINRTFSSKFDFNTEAKNKLKLVSTTLASRARCTEHLIWQAQPPPFQSGRAQPMFNERSLVILQSMD